MNPTRKKLMAVASVMIVMMAGTVVMVNDEDVVEETDAFVDPMTIAIISTVLAFIAGGAAGYALHGILHPDDSTEIQSRADEARILASSLSAGVQYYVNSLSQYSNMWPLTEEHWIRQAEITCAGLWDVNKEYDTSEVLERSEIYVNIGTLLYNAASQVNAHWEDIGNRTTEWNQYVETYGDGKLKLALTFDSSMTISASAGEPFNIRVGGVVRDADSSKNLVYIAGGEIYASDDAVLTPAGIGGNNAYVKGGEWTDLGPDFIPGVYELESGVTYCGNITQVYDVRGADVSAGMVVMVNDTTRVITAYNYQQQYDPDSSTVNNKYKPSCDVTIDGDTAYDKVNLKIIVKEDENSQTVDITDVLARYQMLLNTTYSTLIDVNSSAIAVWEMYDLAGEASAYLTTLVVPDTYENVRLTSEQKMMITTLAMQQLYEYWDTHGEEIKKDSYTMTMDSMSLFCRGDIVITDYTFTDVDGNQKATTVEYKDVIFTPLFSQDYDLEVGDNTVNQTGLVMIWSDEGKPLNTFDVSNPDTADLIFLDDGARLSISSMYYSGEPVSKLHLDATGIEFIDPDVPDIPDPPEPIVENDLGEIIRLILILLGAGILLYGASRGNWLIIIIGGVLILIGFVFANAIADLLDKYLGWFINLP